MREHRKLDVALDALARVTVRTDVVEAGVREAVAEARRRGRPDPARPTRGWWLGLGLPTAFAAGFAAAALVIDAPSAPPEAPAISRRADAGDGSVVEVASGLWIHTSGGAMVQTALTDGAADFRLERGTLGVRLFKGEGRPRRTVAVWSGDVRVRATGTIFSVTRTGDETVAHVTEGTVEIERDDVVLEISAGQMYHAGDVRRADAAPAAHDALAAVAAPPPFEADAPSEADAVSPRATETAPAPDKTRAKDAKRSKPRRGGSAPAPAPRPMPERAPDRPDVAARPADVGPEAHAPAAAELWRTARRLLGEQREAEALDLLQRAAAADDLVWAPIAALELARVRLRRGETGRAADAAGRFLDRFTDHALAPEARSILCRADPSRRACQDPTDD